MKIQTGQVLSVHAPFEWKKPLRYISWMIRFFTRSYWNHSAVFYVINDRVFIVESDINGVVMYPFSNMDDHKTIRVINPSITIDDSRIIARVGLTKYDFRGLILHHIIHIYFGKWIGPTEPGVAYERFTCSEFVAWCHDLPEAYRYRPNQIDDFFTSHGSLIFEGKVSELKGTLPHLEDGQV